MGLFVHLTALALWLHILDGSKTSRSYNATVAVCIAHRLCAVDSVDKAAHHNDNRAVVFRLNSRARPLACSILCGHRESDGDLVSLHQAPRFQAYFSYVEGREVMFMSRRDWERVSQLREGDIREIDLTPTPIADVARDNRIEAAVVVRGSQGDAVVEVYRYDPKDMPKPINLDRYRVWERLPPHRNYAEMVNSASTEDNPNMRGFLEDHVFFVKEVVSHGHRMCELPAHVRAIVGRGGVAL